MEKDNKVTAIIIFLAFICVAILGYIIYFKASKKIEKQEEKTIIIDNPKEEENEEKPNEENDIAELVEKLYSIIGTNPEFRYEELVTYESLSENVRDSIVLTKLSNICEEEKSYEKELFNNSYKEIFNQEKTSEDGLCKLVGASYECTRYCSEFGPKVFNEFEKYEISDDSIIIYEKVGHLDYFDDGKIYLKESVYDENSIASFESLEDLKNSEIDLPVYKHIFSKNGDNYYWTSSELVKQ